MFYYKSIVINVLFMKCIVISGNEQTILRQDPGSNLSTRTEGQNNIGAPKIQDKL